MSLPTQRPSPNATEYKVKLVDFGANGIFQGAPNDDTATYANRRVFVDAAPVNVEATYGRCGACP